jgi:cytochrome c-type biogenesis protein CcmH
MRVSLALILAGSVAACRDAPQPEPAHTPGSAQTLPPGHPPVDASGPPPRANPSGPSVSGVVELAPSLGDRSGAALYIVARSAGGEILAVRKEPAAGFPFRFQISGADAMTEGTAFTGPFDITARLSVSGDAIPARGDVEGTARGVAGGATDVRITLSRVRD